MVVACLFFLRNRWTAFHYGCTILAFSSAVCDWSNFSAPFGVVTVFYFSPFHRYVVTSHCGFNLHFPNGIWCWISLHVLIWHLHILFVYLSISFAHILIGFLTEFWEFFTSSSILVLCQMSCTNIFFQFVACHFILLLGPFMEQKLLMKSYLLIFPFMSHAFCGKSFDSHVFVASV